MSSRGDSTLPAARRPRKSTGHSPVRKRMEKENITVDVASSLASNGGRKKSRSKSMGPGGLDVLKSGSGNRRVSLAAPARPPPRSILKPTIPMLPEIPPHKPKSSARNAAQSPAVQGAENLPNPFQTDDSASSGTKIALRTEEEQQAAAREREERERVQLEKEINDRREARRKSLANRRVSFAAEATLHTFHEVEYVQDSTTSTDSTRRQSSLAAQSSAAAPADSDPSEPPSTPPERVEDVVPESPDHQRDLHQKKNRRRSSVMNFNNPADDTLASSIYSSDSEATEGVIETHEEIGSDSGSDSDADGVSMDLDVDEVTGTSVASAATARSGFTEDSSSTLEDALRLAANRAVTQSLDEEEEIIPSFGWARKPAPKQTSPAEDQENNQQRVKPGPIDDDEDQDGGEMDMDMDTDMEMTKPVGGIIRAQDGSQNDDDDAPDEEISMDVTRVLGRILPQRTKQSVETNSPDEPDEGPVMDEATMEFTTAIGGIRQGSQAQEDLLGLEEDEDMSMELTAVMGSVFPGNKNTAGRRKSAVPRRRTIAAGDDEATMDMTIGVGRIISAGDEEGGEGDATMGMDITTAIGGIIKGPSPVKNRTKAKHLMEEEVDKSDSTPILNSPSKRRISEVIGASRTSETGSPGLSAFRGQGLRRSMNRRVSSSPKRAQPQPAFIGSSPQSSSPLKAGTPQSQVQSSPLKTPPSKNTPKSRPSPSRQGASTSGFTPKSASKKVPALFEVNAATGVSTPQIVLTPQLRRLSGLGADRPGLGSPKVTELLERRSSIGEVADDFVPGSARGATRGVTFADPRVLEEEIDKEREEEADRGNRRSVLEGEADGADEDNNTATLKDMISSMTPKKNPLKGRKSLHVGSASGLLGKRPAELDEDDNDTDERDGIKRLKGHQSSPVKNVRLHAPPSAAETTGRLTRSTRSALEGADANSATLRLSQSPNKGSKTAPSPKGKGRFRDVESEQATNKTNFEDAPAIENPDVPEDGERIHLQDFLNMTNIRFMELTTTKRRHTQAPPSHRESGSPVKEDLSLEQCVVAGACTVPMLELYQHSCRELRKYISEGRRIVREIEMETLEENPPLFKEYVSATPEFKLLMDNQFKNVKTHARLLSKAMWYEWRTQLQDGLKEGLVKIAEGMTSDEQLLQKEQKLLDSVLPALSERLEALQTEHDDLQAIAQELADCDPEDLEAARADLTEVGADVRAKMQKIEELHQQLIETEAGIGEMTEKKQECLADIREAEKVREECRGWTSNEISSLKAKVEDLEKQHGWAITGIADTTVSMSYQREIELVFDIASFRGAKPNSRIDLWYIAANREQNPQPASPEKELFVQCIRDHVRGLAQAQTRISDLLKVVSAAWRKANHVTENMRLLDSTFQTNVTRTSDASIAIRSTLLLVPLETKVEITLGLHGQSTPEGVEVAIIPQAQVVYGEHFKVEKVVEYLTTRIGTRVVTKEEQGQIESWSDVIVELYERLLARGRK
ncbi:hypothetical protein DL769_006064 [Monosporascus sp. CRB-8-3]|nr:hypothetical protein DL769_006064 [Monosporascus sp. CRB-8-3]